jgi:hypothetical protein
LQVVPDGSDSQLPAEAKLKYPPGGGGADDRAAVPAVVEVVVALVVGALVLEVVMGALVVVVVVDTDVVVAPVEVVAVVVTTTSWGAVAAVSRLAYRLVALSSLVRTTGTMPAPWARSVTSMLAQLSAATGPETATTGPGVGALA